MSDYDIIDVAPTRELTVVDNFILNKPKNRYAEGLHYINNTQVATGLLDPTVTEEDMRIAEYGAKNDPNAVAILRVKSEVFDMGKVKLTPFDECVLDACYALALHGATKFSIENLANVLAGKEVKFHDLDTSRYKGALEFLKENPDGTAVIDPSSLSYYEFLHFTVEKLSKLTVTLDCTNLLAPDGQKVFSELKVEGYMLPVEIFHGVSRITKKEKVFYRFLTKSIIYEYAERFNRIACVPAKLLDNGVPNNVETIPLKTAILKKIALMKNSHNNYYTNKISYEWYSEKDKAMRGLLSELGLSREQYSSSSAWRNKKSKIHRDVGLILEKCKEEGMIADYEEAKEGQRIIGYIITP